MRAFKNLSNPTSARNLALAAMCTLALAGCDQIPDGKGAAEEAVQSPVKLNVNLDATGITVPAQGDIEANIIPFGTVRANAEDALHAALGSVKDRQGNAGCPAGPMSSTKYDGITLNFQKDKFVGWFADGGDYLPDLPRAELAEASGGLTRVDESTLGVEYFAGENEGSTISFLFAGEGEDANPSAMWAGVNCIFR